MDNGGSVGHGVGVGVVVVVTVGVAMTGVGVDDRVNTAVTFSVGVAEGVEVDVVDGVSEGITAVVTKPT